MLKPGDFVGPYEIHGFVGEGGMGQVYRAFDPRLERTVALKIIVVPDSLRTPESSSESGRLLGEFSVRLLREARAVASLSHPNVVAIYDVGESDGRLYLAMEYVVGSSLRSLVGQSEPLPRRVRWLVDIAHALEAAHKAGIIHRDIKPENVMVREDGGVKVLDFGIARRTVSRKPDDQHVVDTVTGGGAIAGTPVYMAPEQIKGGEVDARCDQFAWAVLAYELITGARPWVETGDVLSLVANILTEDPPPVRSKVADVPKVVEETILRALAKKPDGRFGTMADVAAALEPFASLTTGRDRVQVTPRPGGREVGAFAEAAYAPTTKIPTIVSLDPSGDPGRREVPKTSTWRAFSLAAPLVLLGALAATVYVVKTRPTTVVTPIPPVATTARPLSSVPAAEAAYKDAMGQWHDGAGAKARLSLDRAIELDPTFAAAYLELALQYASMNETAAAQASFQSAYDHRRTLVHRDERLLEASEPYIRLKPDVEEWETRIMSAIFEYPRDPELQYYLGRARQQQGEVENARAAFTAALRLDEGFVPALAELAKLDQRLGSIADGLAMTERCIRRSPVASTCVQTRYELLFAAGECTRAREEATKWGSLEPQSPLPFGRLARALHADGAPRPSIDEVLARRWSLAQPAKRKEEELWDRMHLAVLDGDFTRAEELARDYDAALAASSDSSDHALPGRLRVNLLMEMDRMKDAAKTARNFLDRLPAWPTYPFAPDPSLDFFEPIYRGGEMTKRELEEKRTDWLAQERLRSGEGRGSREPWTLWAIVYGGFAETREEATDALEHMPRDRGLPGPRASLFLDFALGKVFALLGKWDDALPYLRRVVASCETFDQVMVITRARLLLGQAQEAKGEIGPARANYEKIVETWPKGTPSRTLKRASERLAALAR